MLKHNVQLINDELLVQSFSGAETQRPYDQQNVSIPFLRLRNIQDSESDSSVSSQDSERLLKRRK